MQMAESEKEYKHKQLYELLRIEPTATAEELERSYSALASEAHPSKTKHQPESIAHYVHLAVAFYILNDPRLRQIYDEEGFDTLQDIKDSMTLDDANRIHAGLTRMDHFPPELPPSASSSLQKGLIGNCTSFMSISRTRSSTSLWLDTHPALKKRKREESEGLDSKRNGNARLLSLPLDLWCYIRDYIRWIKLLPLARVCKRLQGLVQTPQVWKGLAEPMLDLSEFKKGEPLVALSEVWRQSTVSFTKVRMAPETTDSVLKLLSGIGVQHLTLRYCRQVSDAGLAHLSELGLLHLDLEGCEQVTDAGLAHLSALPLQHLNLAGCSRVTDAGLAHLSALPLRDIDLDGCGQVTDAGLAHLSALPLQHLNLAECSQVTGAGLAHLSALPLRHLDLDGCRQVTDAGLAHLSALPLRHLDLDGKSTDAGLAHLSALPLRHLNLLACVQVTDAGLAHLSALPLRHLDLTACRQVTDAGLAHLSALPLQRLDLDGCRQVTDAGLAHLSALPPQHLDLYGCEQVTDAELAHLYALPPDVPQYLLDNLG
eukprot:g2496.t1